MLFQNEPVANSPSFRAAPGRGRVADLGGKAEGHFRVTGVTLDKNATELALEGVNDRKPSHPSLQPPISLQQTQVLMSLSLPRPPRRAAPANGRAAQAQRRASFAQLDR